MERGLVAKTDEWQDVLDVDFPTNDRITEEDRINAIYYGQRGLIKGNVRLALGQFYTTEEYEYYRADVMNKANLP